jgi:hypothetical protein
MAFPERKSSFTILPAFILEEDLYNNPHHMLEEDKNF